MTLISKIIKELRQCIHQLEKVGISGGSSRLNPYFFMEFLLILSTILAKLSKLQFGAPFSNFWNRCSFLKIINVNWEMKPATLTHIYFIISLLMNFLVQDVRLNMKTISIFFRCSRYLVRYDIRDIQDALPRQPIRG